jgi:hypothetical protein
MVGSRFTADSIELLPLHIRVVREKSGFFSKPTVLEHDIKSALLPDLVGTLTIVTERPRYDWVLEPDRKTQSHAITRDTSFTFGPLVGSSPTRPAEGDQKFGKEVSATCGPVTQKAWRFPNGLVVPDIAPLFQTGWSSSSYVGEPEPPDWDKFENECFAAFGFKFGFWTARRCSHGQYCKISPDELRARATQIDADFQDCASMRMVEKNIDDQSAAITIRGTASLPSLWTVTLPVYTYKQVEIVKDNPVVIPVYSSKPIELIIQNPKKTVSELYFSPKNEPPQSGSLPNNIPHGPQYVDHSDYGENAIKYTYRFGYDKRAFDVN